VFAIWRYFNFLDNGLGLGYNFRLGVSRQLKRLNGSDSFDGLDDFVKLLENGRIAGILCGIGSLHNRDRFGYRLCDSFSDGGRDFARGIGSRRNRRRIRVRRRFRLRA
jgi:hypothetical protein